MLIRIMGVQNGTSYTIAAILSCRMYRCLDLVENACQKKLSQERRMLIKRIERCEDPIAVFIDCCGANISSNYLTRSIFISFARSFMSGLRRRGWFTGPNFKNTKKPESPVPKRAT